MIDWTRLHTLRSDIGEEDFADVAFLFVSEIEDHLKGLRGAEDTATVADFHFLRGSASNLGFVALVEACERAEAACIGGTRPDIDGIANIFHKSVAEVAPEIPELAEAA